MCARCEVDIGSKMSKTERRESENLFFFFFLRKSQFNLGLTCSNSSYENGRMHLISTSQTEECGVATGFPFSIFLIFSS